MPPRCPASYSADRRFRAVLHQDRVPSTDKSYDSPVYLYYFPAIPASLFKDQIRYG